jgi:ADP-ribosylglycohydrolase
MPARRQAHNRLTTDARNNHNGAFVLQSLPAAFYCFLRSLDDAEQLLCTAVNGAHDADTFAAMAATLRGALLGKLALPKHLVERVGVGTSCEILGTDCTK